jgi:hypothetical protein
MIPDIRKKEELTYEEALHHLWRLLNADTYRKISKAINAELDRVKA